ncbi:MAG: tripartite tricarboxylate transporter TctB family protein [Oscillospiraceae bacterium]|nr:tripartite tricarboxylate transporter TctB family protein [Oscillospiraceae bacterium]
MKKYNYIISAVMIAIAGYVFYETSKYQFAEGAVGQKNPAMWPRFLAILLIILSVLLIIETIFKKQTEEEKKTKVIDWGSAGMKKVYLMVGIVALFVLLMQVIGMLLALLVCLPLMMLLMGCKNKLMLIIYPLGLVGFCYVFFELIMTVTLPPPIWA